MEPKSKNNKTQKAVEAFYAIDAATSIVLARLHKAKAFGDLTPTQYSVMVTLLEHGPVNQTRICSVISKTNGSVVLVIDNLSKHGLAKREASKEDRRSNVVQLTDAGRKLIASLVEHHDQAFHEAMSALDENQLDRLTELARNLAGVGERGE